MALFTNQATLSYNGNTVNSNIVTGNIVEVLSASKTAVTDSYTAGDDVTYVVSIVNSGTTAITGVTVTDNLGAYTVGTGTATPLSYKADSVLYYQNGVLQPTPTVIDTNPLTITGITVPADGNALLVYEAEVNSFAPLASGSTITNEVAVTAPGITSPVTAQETVTVSDAPVLSITKALSPENVTENSELTYLVTAANADAGGRVINRMMADYAAAHDNVFFIKSLGLVRYLKKQYLYLDILFYTKLILDLRIFLMMLLKEMIIIKLFLMMF